MKGLKIFGIIALIAVFIIPTRQQITGRIAELPAANSATVNNVPATQWYLDSINANETWKLTSGANVIIAVLDTGIDGTQEDLTGRVIDSINFSTSETAKDINGHGTFIAGIIAASMKDMQGTVGVAFNSSLLNIKIADDSGIVTPEAAAKGIIWAVDNGAMVLNLSFTLNKPNQMVEDAIKYALSKGAVIVAASGNDYSSKPVYPAAYEGVISVAATDRDDKIPNWSNKGDWINVTAPGVDIYSTLPGNKYSNKSGTSFSAALVSGEAALLFALADNAAGAGASVRTAIINQTTTGDNIRRIDLLEAVRQFGAMN